MRFVVQDNLTHPDTSIYPFVILLNDRWDDYTFKTSFRSVVCLSQHERLELGIVKILKRGQEAGRTPIPAQFFHLPDDYCSLGQEMAYYERLVAYGLDFAYEYLRAMRDVAASSSIRSSFEHMQGFRVSLIRDGSAARALDDASILLFNRLGDSDHLDLTFTTKLGDNSFTVPLSFEDSNELPARLIAIIGYNGSGKTQLLGNLAWVGQADLEARRRLWDTYGHFDGPSPRFGHVIAISYSAFDTFALPTSEAGDGRDVMSRSFTYCGLRRYDRGSVASNESLKSWGEIKNELKIALEKVDTAERREALGTALTPLWNEPSFARIGTQLDLLGSGDLWEEDFDSLSTGHKISINIIVQMVGHLQMRSLVLIDEPESHLHPPLLAALMKGIHSALRSHSSYGIVATHSPVVLQEIPARYVRVLRRHGRRTSVETPELETFGENVGLLTRHVFNLDNSASDFEGILARLAARYSLEELEELFENGLSSQARALVMQYQARVTDV